MDNTYDKNLVQQLAKDKEKGRSAFLEIYNRYAPGIYRAGLQHLQSASSAEDLVQEVFSKLWSKRKKFTHVRDLKRYLYVMAKNEAFKQFNKLASKEQAHKEFNKHRELIDNSDKSKDKYDYLLKTIEELPPRQRQVFELAKMHGLSHQEIAEQLNISPKTVNNHITKALKYIRSHGHLPVVTVAFLVFTTCLRL